MPWVFARVTCLTLLGFAGCGRIAFEARDDGKTSDAPGCTVRHDAVTAFASGGQPRALLAADLDRNGTQDLAVANGMGNSLSVLLGNGDGTFATHVDYATGASPYSLDIGDIDNDGDLDVAVGNFDDNTISIFKNHGDGVFDPQLVQPQTGFTNPQNTKLGDIDGDGLLDLVVTQYGMDQVSVAYGNGNGTFIDPPSTSGITGSTPSRPYASAIGRFGGPLGTDDAFPDIMTVVSNAGYARLFLSQGAARQIISSTGGGPTGAAPIVQPWDIQTSDLDRNGHLDLVIANNNFNPTSTISVERGIGLATFSPPVEYPSSGFPWTISINDVTGDGVVDVVVADGQENTVSVFPGNGDTTLQPRIVYAGGNTILSVTTADFDGDGLVDIAAASQMESRVLVRLATCQ